MNIYLDLGKDIPGECTIEGFKDQIVLESFSFGVSNDGMTDPSNGTRTLGKGRIGSVNCSKPFDLASAKFMQYCMTSSVIPKATLTVGQEVNKAFEKLLEVVLENCYIQVNSTMVHGTGESRPHDSFAIDFSKITVTYKPQVVKGEKKGQNQFIWDLATNVDK
jgi:type VI secretion system secreted protein Hcp